MNNLAKWVLLALTAGPILLYILLGLLGFLGSYQS